MNETIRVLHIVYILNRGGMESRIMDLYRHMDLNKYQFDFYVESGAYGVFEDEIKEKGGRIFHNESKGKHRIPNFNAFRSFLEQHSEYRIVYAYNQWSGMYLKEAKKYGIPNRIAYARTAIQTKSFKNSIKNLVKRKVNLYATQRFAVSQKAGIWLFGDKCIKNGDVIVWPNAIDTEQYKFDDQIRNQVRCGLALKNELTIIHVGNIRFEKNHLFLLEVFAVLKRTHKHAKLILIGGGDFSILKSKIFQLGIEDSIIYLGERNDVPRLLQAGDIFIFPSLYEGFPGAVLEAEASGLWCLVADTITDEVELTNHIKRIPLEKGADGWAALLKEYKPIDRTNVWRVIYDARYDVNDLAKKTEMFYHSLIK